MQSAAYPQTSRDWFSVSTQKSAISSRRPSPHPMAVRRRGALWQQAMRCYDSWLARVEPPGSLVLRCSSAQRRATSHPARRLDRRSSSCFDKHGRGPLWFRRGESVASRERIPGAPTSISITKVRDGRIRASDVPRRFRVCPCDVCLRELNTGFQKALAMPLFVVDGLFFEPREHPSCS